MYNNKPSVFDLFSQDSLRYLLTCRVLSVRPCGDDVFERRAYEELIHERRGLRPIWRHDWQDRRFLLCLACGSWDSPPLILTGVSVIDGRMTRQLTTRRRHSSGADDDTTGARRNTGKIFAENLADFSDPVS